MDIFRPEDPISKLEGELRSERPTLDRSVQRTIVRRVQPQGGSARRATLALVLTTATLGAMTAFGGVGYAFSTVGHSFGFNSASNSPFQSSGTNIGSSWGVTNGYTGPSSNCEYSNHGGKGPKGPKGHDGYSSTTGGKKGGGFGFFGFFF